MPIQVFGYGSADEFAKLRALPENDIKLFAIAKLKLHRAMRHIAKELEARWSDDRYVRELTELED